MLIDWFTVGAQALNFAVLVWLLKRFLYRPVLDAIAAREGRIATQLADAAATQRGAEALRQDFIDRRDALARERSSLMDQAARDAKLEGDRLIAAARQAGDELRAKREQALRSEAQAWQRSLAELAQREVVEITRRALADLASASLEQRLADVFVRRLADLDAPARQTLAAALDAPHAQPVLRSAFELPQAQREAIQAAVKQCLGVTRGLAFVTAPELVMGIELEGAGRQLAWGIAPYLDGLARGVSELVDNAEGPSPSVVAPMPATPLDASAAATRPKDPTG